jgi:hypothetical protein
MATGIIAVGMGSLWYALLYSLLTIVCLGVIVAVFCLKCPCRLTECGPMLFGPLTRIIPQQPARPYRKQDIYQRNTALFIIMAIPQLWLIRPPALFVVFWILAIVRGIHLVKGVCGSCQNRFCRDAMKLV